MTEEPAGFLIFLFVCCAGIALAFYLYAWAEDVE